MLVLLATGANHLRAKLPPEKLKLLPPPAARPVDFHKDVQPIFEASCVQCHARGKSKGGFRLDTRETFFKGGDSGPVAVTGKSAESLLIELVSGLNPDDVMPQKGTRLTPTQVGLLRAWIDQGAPWAADITFAKPPPRNLHPRLPVLPPAKDDATHPVDRLLGPHFAQHRLQPGSPVSDTVFARRVYLDIIGLLPAPDELRAFLEEPGAGKRERLVESLLADDRRYAEHWLSFWNDLLRNDYRGTGYIDGGRKQISGWLHQALKQNLPYDKFVAQLISPLPESEGFIRGIIWRGTVNSSQTPQMQAAQNVSQVFLGVNLKCASCHDSFVSDWTLADAYGMAAVFADGPLEMFKCDKPTGNTTTAKFLFPELGEIKAEASKAERMKRLAEIATATSNGRLSRTIVNRLWKKFLGVGLVEPVDDMEQPAWHPDLLDWLAEDLVAHGWDLKHTMKVILTSRACQLPAVSLDEQKHADYVFTGPAVRRLSAEQFRDALGQLTGVWYDKAEVAAAASKSAPEQPKSKPAHRDVRASLVTADPLAVALGRPNREQVNTTRASAATTLQALELTNGETLNKLFRRGAENLLANHAASASALVEQLYRLALGRPPTSAEQELAITLVGQPARTEGVEDLLWAVAMLPEFQLIH